MSTSEDFDELERTAGEPTGIARCAPLDGAEPPFTVHGVAIGAGDVTFGKNGPKFWPAGELRRAAASLVGQPLTKNHDDERVESVIGEVVDAGFEDDVGVVYEAEVDDRTIAQKIARGRLEVSVHAAHGNGGRTDDGAMIAEDIRFLDLSVVPRGAAPSNSVETGSSPAQALASLSADEVSALLDDSADRANADSTDSTTQTMTDTETDSPDEAPEADAEDDVEDVDPDAEADADADADVEADDDVGPDDDVEPDAEADADADAEAGHDVDEADEAELREELTELRAENMELREELEAVRMEYAERLAEDAPFTASELAETFSFDTLQEKFEEHEASLTDVSETSDSDEGTPAPQTGDVSEDEELSTGSDDDVAAQIATLEAQVEKYDELGWERAKAEAEDELAELRE